MSLPNKIRLFLGPDPISYYYVDANGAVQTTSTPTPIKEDPSNLDNLQIGWARNIELYGVFRGVASSMDFVEDGATICRHVFYTQGFDGDLYFLAEEIKGDSTGYDVLYSGKVNFKKPNDQLTAFTAEIIEGGLVSLVESNMDTPYQIPVESIDATPVFEDGIDLQTENNYVTLDNIITPLAPQDRIAIGIVGIPPDVAYTTGRYKTADSIAMPSSFIVNSAEYNNWIFKAEKDATISVRFFQKIDYQLFTASSSFTIEAQIWLVVLADGATNPYIDVAIWTDPAGALNNVSGKRTIYPSVIASPFSIHPGDQVYLEFRVFESGSASNHTTVRFYDRGEFEIDSIFRLAPTIAYGYRPAEVHAKLTDKFTAGAYAGVSAYLSDPSVNDYDSIPQQVIYTPADSLRRLTTNSVGATVDPLITITLRQFFNDVHGRWLVGMGINAANELFIERLSAFFDASTMILDLGEVSNVSISNADEYLFGQFKTGFGKQNDYDKANGRTEPITSSVWKMPFNTAFPERDFVSTLRADPTGIENIRSNLSKKKTVDAESDNDTFLIDIDTTQTTFTPSGSPTAVTAYNIRRPNNSGNTSGVFSPDSIYNISLTPARNANRLGPLTHSIAWKQGGKDISFQGSEKNEYLVSNIGSGTITENAPISVGGLKPILFKPLAIKVDTPAPTALAAFMASQPYGYVRATNNGREIKGFVLDVSRKPFKEDIRNWVLLATPDFDETQFT